MRNIVLCCLMFALAALGLRDADAIADERLHDYQAAVMVDLARKHPSPPGLFVVWDGFASVVKRIDPIAHSNPPSVLIKSVNPAYETYQRTLEEAYILGRFIWFGRRL